MATQPNSSILKPTELGQVGAATQIGGLNYGIDKLAKKK